MEKRKVSEADGSLFNQCFNRFTKNSSLEIQAEWETKPNPQNICIYFIYKINLKRTFRSLCSIYVWLSIFNLIPEKKKKHIHSPILLLSSKWSNLISDLHTLWIFSAQLHIFLTCKLFLPFSIFFLLILCLFTEDF